MARVVVPSAAVSRSLQNSPQASPRRRPRKAMRRNSRPIGSVSTPSRKTAVCSAVQTATGGRVPPARQALTRGSVHTTGCGRRPGDSSRSLAALRSTRPRRWAVDSAVRRVARSRVWLAADSGLLRRGRRLMAASMAATSSACRSARGMPPRWGEQVKPDVGLIRPKGAGPKVGSAGQPAGQPLADGQDRPRQVVPALQSGPSGGPGGVAAAAQPAPLPVGPGGQLESGVPAAVTAPSQQQAGRGPP